MSTVAVMPSEATAVRREAIQRSAENANKGWQEYMLDVVYRVALAKPSFTTDDVRELFEKDQAEAIKSIPYTHDYSAIGPVMLEATAQGFITTTENSVRRSTRPSAHGRFITLWHSTVYNEAA